MMISDKDIAHELADGGLSVQPYEPDALQPASLDVRLAADFRVFTQDMYSYIDPSYIQTGITRPYRVASEAGAPPFVLQPGQFALGSTLERVAIPAHLAARLEGKSSLGRLGLMVHSTAGFIDPGFRGTITLELSNMTTLPIRLRPGMWIGQLCFFRLSSPAHRPYGTPGLGSRYQDQEGATPSLSYMPR